MKRPTLNSYLKPSSMILLIGICLLLTPTFAFAVDGKRGWAGGQPDSADAANAYWYYNWWHTKPSGDQNADADWIPLVKFTNNLANKIDIITGYSDVDTVLVLNEPERASQSDVTVAEAISIWPQFEATGLNLITPGISDDPAGRAWLADFMTQANANNYRMDGLAFHWYGASTPNNPAGAASNFLSRVDHYWNTYGLPVWITEFAIHDWGGNYTDQQILDANEQFLDIVVPALESRSYVEAYSFYQWFSDSTLLDGTPLTPTNVGDAYIPSYTTGEIYDVNGNANTTDIFYLKGGQVTNSGAAQISALMGLDAVEGTNSITGAADWGITGGNVVVRSGATLQKNGTNMVSIVGPLVQNDGSINVVSGTLTLRGGSQLTGSGQTQVDPGSTLEFGALPDRAGVQVSQALELHGGTIRTNEITDGTHSISGTTTLHDMTTFEGDGYLAVTGTLTSPAVNGGGLRKSGTGTLNIASTADYTGETLVEEGTLQLRTGVTLSDTPTITVEPGAVLDVTQQAGGYSLANQELILKGQVSGSVDASAGAQVTVLDSGSVVTGNLTLTNATLSVGGNGFNETGPIGPIVSAGLNLNFDASLDSAGDAIWTNEVAPGNDFSFAGPATPSSVSNPALPGITAAYDIATAGSLTGLNGYFEQTGSSTQRSREDATFEIVFHVSNDTAGSQQVLFEAGGSSRGISFTLDNSTLSFNVDGDSSTFTLNSALATGWHQAVGVIDLVGVSDDLANDTMHLYVDNQLIGTLNNLLIDDWAGGNIAGIGGVASSGPSPGGSLINYHGDIAIARYYSNNVFDAGEVNQNYMALTGSGAMLPTTAHVSGDLNLATGSVIELDLSDLNVADMIDISGVLSIAGATLDVSYIGTAALVNGNSFDLLDFSSATGTFAAVNLPTLDAGLYWDDSNLLTTGVISVTNVAPGIPGDFDGDGFVGLSDLNILGANWNMNVTPSTQGDADGDGFVGLADLNTLGNNWSPPPSVSVPEPTALFLLMCGLGGMALKRH